MPTGKLRPLSGRYLSFAEQEEIALLRAQGHGVREIGRRLGRSASTISRELRRNAATRGGEFDYRATTAQWHADRRGMLPKPRKLQRNSVLREYVEHRLSGTIRTQSGEAIAGPKTSFNGLMHGKRQDRRWAMAWSPEQISQRLRTDYPLDESMRISHEAIYRALYIEGRDSLPHELVRCLRTGRPLRVPRKRTRRGGKSFVEPKTRLAERPAEANDRVALGHWEGDLIIGSRSSAIGTLVERATRYTLLLHLPPMAGHGERPREKNGPALAGHGATAVREAITISISTLPSELCQTLTWDQGAEMSQHARLQTDTGLAIYFCDPQSHWQRGTNENTNGLLRQYFPKGTDLSRHSPEELEAVCRALNSRPRKSLGWQTPTKR
jgi:IS30 family transposase